MTPGLALFYGGMVRAKNVLGMLMQNYFALGIVSVLWAVVAYSLAFGGDGHAHRELRLRVHEGRRRASSRPALDADRATVAVLRVPDDVRHHHARTHHRRGRRPHAVQGLGLVHRPLGRARVLAGRPLGLRVRRAGSTTAATARSTSPAAPWSTSTPASQRSPRCWSSGGAGVGPSTPCRPTRCRSRSSAPASCGSAGSGSTRARRCAGDEVAVQALVNTHMAAAAGMLAWLVVREVPQRARHDPGCGVGCGRRPRRHHALRRLRRLDERDLHRGDRRRRLHVRGQLEDEVSLRRLARRGRRAPRRRDRRYAAARLLRRCVGDRSRPGRRALRWRLGSVR